MASAASRQPLTINELLIVIVISLASFMIGLDATIVNIALPTIAASFGVSAVTASWVLNAFFIVMVSLLLAASRIGDIKGYRNLFLAGFLIFMAGSAASGIAPDYSILILARIFQAVGAAVISAVGAVMVTSYLPSSVRGQALGIVAMFLMLGIALGPVTGGVLAGSFSWRYIFFVNVPIGIVAVLLGARVLPRLEPVSPQATLDIPGVALFLVALAFLIFGLTSFEKNNPLTGGATLVVSFIFWIAFWIRECRTPEPLINLSLFKNRAYSSQNICLMIVQMVMSGVMVIMPFYLEIIRGVTPDNAGLVLLSLPAGMILTSPISGKVSDVIGTKRPIIAGFGICLAAMLLLSTISADTGIGWIGMLLFLLGAGSGIAFSPLTSAIMGEASLKDRGATSGLMRVMSNLGSTLGVASVMCVAALVAGPKIAQVAAHLIPLEELVPAFDMAFLFCMLLEVAGIALMLTVKARSMVTAMERTTAA